MLVLLAGLDGPRCPVAFQTKGDGDVLLRAYLFIIHKCIAVKSRDRNARRRLWCVLFTRHLLFFAVDCFIGVDVCGDRQERVDKPRKAWGGRCCLGAKVLPPVNVCSAVSIHYYVVYGRAAASSIIC